MQNSTEQSKAHRLFFAKTTSRGVFSLHYNDYWDAKLGESGAEVMRRFIAEGLIKPASVEYAVDKQFTADQLKPLLKERGLKVGGKKTELVARIITADPGWAASIADGHYERTDEGNDLAEIIWQEVRSDDADGNIAFMHLIHERRYPETFDRFAEWDATQVFPKLNCSRAEFLLMCQEMDGLLDGEREQAIYGLLDGNPYYSQGAMTTLFAGYYARDLRQWRETPGVVGVRIEPPNDGRCKAAAQHAGCYRIEDAPEYPFWPCDLVKDGDLACQCLKTCIFDDEVSGIEWKIPARRSSHAGPPAQRHPMPPSRTGATASLAMMMDAPLIANTNGAGIVIQATTSNSKPDDSMDLPIGFARRVMENKAFGVSLGGAIVFAIWLVL